VHGSTWENGKQNVEIRKLLGLQPVGLVIKKGRLRWFRHVEHKIDEDLVKCKTLEANGSRRMGHLRKNWWDCVKVIGQVLSIWRGGTA